MPFRFISHLISHMIKKTLIPQFPLTCPSTELYQPGSPYGASCIANADGSRKPSAVELEIAEHQGKYFGNFVGTFVKGRSAA